MHKNYIMFSQNDGSGDALNDACLGRLRQHMKPRAVPCSNIAFCIITALIPMGLDCVAADCLCWST